MRVIAGKAKRLPLKTVKGSHTRPTTDRIKETLFNILQDDIPGSRFLDFFAGSGGIGIEALSRGASYAVFVDNDREAVSCIKENLAFTRLLPLASVIRMDAVPAVGKIEAGPEGNRQAFDIVFMDPPYDRGLERPLLERLADSPIVSDHTLFIAEASLGTDLSWLDQAGYSIERLKEYKTNMHVFIRKNRTSEAAKQQDRR